MSYMFNGCSGLVNLDISNFVTTNVTDMSSMFNGCSGLVNLDISNFVTTKVTKMSSMFNGCSGLVNLDISNFLTPRVTKMSSMFNGCSGLVSLDIRNMDFENKTITTTDIFKNVPSGVNIYVSNEYNQQFIQGLKSNANVIIPEA